MFSHQPPTDRQLRWFGLSLSGLILILGLLAYWRWQVLAIVIAAAMAAVGLSLVFYLVPSSRRPIHRAFSVCVYPIQFLVTLVLLAIVYFAVLTPIALFLRMRGYDALNRRQWKTAAADSATTFWVRRDPSPPSDRYFKTY